MNTPIQFAIQYHPQEFGSRGRLKEITKVVPYVSKGLSCKFSVRMDEETGFDEKGSKNREKYGYRFIQENGHAHEWWNFYENFENDWYYARVQFSQHPIRFKEDGLVLFISKNVYDYKVYFTGIYGKAKFGYFKTGKEFKDLLPESYLSRIDKERNQYTKNLFENFEHEPNFKGLKSFSTNFDKGAYILIEAGDIGIKKFGHAPFCYVGDRETCKTEFSLNLLNEAKIAHEKLLLRDLDDERKLNINKIINKIEKIIIEYFSDKKQEINYWRINIGTNIEEWPGLIRENKIAIGFASEYIKKKLFEYKDRDELKNDFINIKKEIKNISLNPPSAASQIWNFLKKIKKGDKIVANKGYTILGIGEAGEDVWYEENSDHPITRRINWIKIVSPFRITKELEGKFMGTIKSLSRDHYNTILEMIPEDIKIEFDEEMEKIYKIIEYKKQIIFYGPPGTGKTYTARKFSFYKSVDKTYYLEYIDDIKKEKLINLIRYLTFHPSYSYEEFIEGLKPVINEADNGKIFYNVEEGLFKTACRDAFNILLHYCNIPVFWKKGEELPELKYSEKLKILNIIKLKKYPKIFLIIDEINRGDISRIFGELITLLEMDKRLFAEEELIVNLPYSKKRFGIPPNLYIIGTLNTADRSIALLDFALRRRFSFLEFMPKYDLLEELLIVRGVSSKISDLRKLSIKALEVINRRISEVYDKDHQIGHSYLICLKDELNYEKTLDKVRTIWLSELIPLLREYFYESEKKLKTVLNNIDLGDFKEGDLIQILKQIGKEDID